MKHISRIAAVVATLCLFICCFSGCSSSQQSAQPTPSNTLTAHFIDVGQGDSEFLELPDEKTLLIDAGEWDQANTVKSYIKNLGYSRIDYVVATHPHSDHIGGMAEVLQSFDIGEVWAPKVTHTTKTYEHFLEAVADKGLKINATTRGTSIYDEQDYSIKILSPFLNADYDDLNDWSTILKVTKGEKSFLFTGDASSSVIAKAQAGHVDVLKVGHHGSKTATTNDLVASLSPEWAVIEVGTDNDYGHPSKKALSALEKNGVMIYRTDLNGSIIATCDGKTIEWKTEKGEV